MTNLRISTEEAKKLDTSKFIDLLKLWDKGINIFLYPHEKEDIYDFFKITTGRTTDIDCATCVVGMLNECVEIAKTLGLFNTSTQSNVKELSETKTSVTDNITHKSRGRKHKNK